MKKMLLAALALSTATTTSYAVIIDNNLTTIDTGAGLEWLDVTQTVNLSYNVVSARLNDPNDSLFGYRYATVAELTNLVDTWLGYPTSGHVSLAPGDESLDPLIQMLGNTYIDYSGSGETQTYGMLANETSYGWKTVGMIDDYSESNPNLSDYFNANYTANDKTRAIQELGSFLVRDYDPDGDGVYGDADACPDTVIPESAPTSGELGSGRYALTTPDVKDQDGFVIFDKGSNAKGTFSTEDTAGCSCEQIVAALGAGAGQLKYGCSKSVMETWIDIH